MVDEEHGILELVKVYLEKEGWRFTLAWNEAQANNKIVTRHPDIIVLDVMPSEINNFNKG